MPLVYSLRRCRRKERRRSPVNPKCWTGLAKKAKASICTRPTCREFRMLLFRMLPRLRRLPPNGYANKAGTCLLLTRGKTGMIIVLHQCSDARRRPRTNVQEWEFENSRKCICFSSTPAGRRSAIFLLFLCLRPWPFVHGLLGAPEMCLSGWQDLRRSRKKVSPACA